MYVGQSGQKVAGQSLKTDRQTDRRRSLQSFQPGGQATRSSKADVWRMWARPKSKSAPKLYARGSRSGDEDVEITEDTIRCHGTVEGWLMDRWMPTTRVMVLFGVAVGSCRGVGEDVWGKEISGGGQVRGASDLGLIKEGVGPVLISA